MKQPFRYFRGEFACGKYLYALVTCPNFAVQGIIDELVYQALSLWALEGEAEAGRMAAREADIIGIAKTAGLFQPVVFSRSSAGSIAFTQSHVVNGRERSERGLFDTGSGGFKFVRTLQDDYEGDIADEASSGLRASFVPDGAEPEGFVPYGSELYAGDGGVIRGNLLPSPPEGDLPYAPYYGEKFLTHEEIFEQDELLDIGVFKLLFECVQRVRHNGPTTAEFLEITGILGAGYIRGIEIEPRGAYFMAYYRLDDLADVANKDRRLAAWLNICSQKFKLFVLENRA